MNVNETTDEVKFQIPKVEFSAVTAEYDKYSKALRLLDTKIQETNWLTEIDFDDSNLNV